MRIGRIAVVLLLCGIAVLTRVGATGHGESDRSRPLPAPDAPRVLAIAGGLDGATWSAIRAGLLAASRDLNIDLAIATVTAERTDRVRDEQINHLESAAALGYEAVVLVPFDPDALSTYVEATVADGIPVVAALRTIDERTPTVATDAHFGGSWLADRVFDRSSRAATIGVVLGSDFDTALHDALHERLTAVAPDARILPGVRARDEDAVRRLVEEVRFTSPSVTTIVALGSETVLAVWEVARFAPGVQLYGSGADARTVDLLERGEIEALVTPDTYTIGYRSLEVLERLRRGEEVGPVVTVPPLFLDRDSLRREQTRRALERVIH